MYSWIKSLPRCVLIRNVITASFVIKSKYIFLSITINYSKDRPAGRAPACYHYDPTIVSGMADTKNVSPTLHWRPSNVIFLLFYDNSILRTISSRRIDIAIKYWAKMNCIKVKWTIVPTNVTKEAINYIDNIFNSKILATMAYILLIT